MLVGLLLSKNNTMLSKRPLQLIDEPSIAGGGWKRCRRLPGGLMSCGRGQSNLGALPALLIIHG
jgi:hypothetical protein